MLGPVVEMVILNKANGSKVKDHFRLLIKGLTRTGCHTLRFKEGVDRDFLSAILVGRTIKVGFRPILMLDMVIVRWVTSYLSVKI